MSYLVLEYNGPQDIVHLRKIKLDEDEDDEGHVFNWRVEDGDKKMPAKKNWG